MAKRIIRMSRNGLTNSGGEFDWDDALIDATIAAGGTFFSWLAMKRNITVSERQ